MQIDKTIAGWLRPLRGLPCWNAQRGYGSFLTMEFGAPRLDIRGPTPKRHRHVFVKGAYHLWIQMCDWTIEANGTELANSESSDEVIDKAMRQVDSRYLERLRLDARNKSAALTFESGVTIAMQAFDDWEPDLDWDIWLLFGPDHIIAYDLSGALSYNNREGDERKRHLTFDECDIVL